MTQKNPRGFRAWYGDLKLQSKFTLALTLIVVVPAILVAVFFYHQLYDMVVSNTIRKEQISSAKTAPLIEDTVDDVTAAYDDLASIPFFKTIFHNPVSTPMGYVTHGEQAEEFKEKVSAVCDSHQIRGIRIYVDIPADQNSLLVSENTCDLFLPISQARGTYWYGIFQGSHMTELYCPPFYLGAKEKRAMGIWPISVRSPLIITMQSTMPMLLFIIPVPLSKKYFQKIWLLREVYPILLMTVTVLWLPLMTPYPVFTGWTMIPSRTPLCPLIISSSRIFWGKLYTQASTALLFLTGTW